MVKQGGESGPLSRGRIVYPFPMRRYPPSCCVIIHNLWACGRLVCELIVLILICSAGCVARCLSPRGRHQTHLHRYERLRCRKQCFWWNVRPYLLALTVPSVCVPHVSHLLVSLHHFVLSNGGSFLFSFHFLFQSSAHYNRHKKTHLAGEWINHLSIKLLLRPVRRGATTLDWCAVLCLTSNAFQFWCDCFFTCHYRRLLNFRMMTIIWTARGGGGCIMFWLFNVQNVIYINTRVIIMVNKCMFLNTIMQCWRRAWWRVRLFPPFLSR